VESHSRHKITSHICPTLFIRQPVSKKYKSNDTKICKRTSAKISRLKNLQFCLDQGSLLRSQFSAIFANFLQKMGVFLKNQSYDIFLRVYLNMSTNDTSTDDISTDDTSTTNISTDDTSTDDISTHLLAEHLQHRPPLHRLFTTSTPLLFWG
jgi:hypothetical protein